MEIHETELIDGLRSGESKAYRTLFDNYYHLLFRIACQYVRDDTVADTIVGDVLSHIWETRTSLRITSSLQAYLVCCVRNYALNYQKKIFADREISLDDYEEYPEAILQGLFLSDEYPLGHLLEKELNEQILQEIDKLPRETRQVFICSRIEELGYNEIADKVGISVNTVKYHIKQALATLRSSMKGYLSSLLF
ncbi:RNA polymerase sigma-70 factor [uncultured Parabacteroides sp.]|uniref:RNA polymerase sigma-70 factor n=1 Tax=uncultured Parabacteroides sp. TaxID=512312 RepID=UPI00259B0440|nr:RNA polymerase sigma-70 factor [uncultured Parabacteroides sp.]